MLAPWASKKIMRTFAPVRIVGWFFDKPSATGTASRETSRDREGAGEPSLHASAPLPHSRGSLRCRYVDFKPASP